MVSKKVSKKISKWQPKSHVKPSKSGYILCVCSSKIQNFTYVHCINDRKIFSIFLVNTLCIRDSVSSALDSFGFIVKLLAKLFKTKMQIVIVQIEKEWLLAIYEISFVVSASLVSNIFMYLMANIVSGMLYKPFNIQHIESVFFFARQLPKFVK